MVTKTGWEIPSLSLTPLVTSGRQKWRGTQVPNRMPRDCHRTMESHFAKAGANLEWRTENHDDGSKPLTGRETGKTDVFTDWRQVRAT